MDVLPGESGRLCRILFPEVKTLNPLAFLGSGFSCIYQVVTKCETTWKYFQLFKLSGARFSVGIFEATVLRNFGRCSSHLMRVAAPVSINGRCSTI